MFNLPSDRRLWRGFPKEYDLMTEGITGYWNIYILTDWDDQEVVVYVPVRNGGKNQWGKALTAEEWEQQERERAYLQRRYGTHHVRSITDYWIRA